MVVYLLVSLQKSSMNTLIITLLNIEHSAACPEETESSVDYHDSDCNLYTNPIQDHLNKPISITEVTDIIDIP